MSMTSSFKSYFLRGMAVLLPTMLTIWIFIWGFNFIQSNVGMHINRGLVWLTLQAQGISTEEPAEPEKQQWLERVGPVRQYWLNGWGRFAGFIIALIAVGIVGWILATVVGRTLWKMVEKFIMNLPGVRGVYPYIKQITDFLFAENRKDQLFLRAVGVEYPRKGIWSIGLVTGEGLPSIVGPMRKEFLTVLIPTSPTPFTGFVIMVPKKETIELDISIEEAMRFTLSGGVITPSTKLDEYKKPQLDEADSKVDGDDAAE